MDKDWIHSLVSRVASGSLLAEPFFAAMDCDAALDARDSDPAFEQAWAELLADVDRHWATADVAAADRALAEHLRHQAFLAASRATGQHEIASQVSDDFDLIVRGRLAGLGGHPFLMSLWRAYDAGDFPTPPLDG